MNIEESSGNTYRDLGFDEPTAQTLHVQSTLLIEVVRVIRQRKLSPSDAATLFGVSVDDIKEIEGSNLERFSVDRLIAMLARAGVEVSVNTDRKAA